MYTKNFYAVNWNSSSLFIKRYNDYNDRNNSNDE